MRKLTNEVKLTKYGNSLYAPWCVPRASGLYTPSVLCGEAVSKLAVLPGRTKDIVLVFSPFGDQHSWHFKRNTRIHTVAMAPWIITGTRRVQLHQEMDCILTVQHARGNNYFRIEYDA